MNYTPASRTALVATEVRAELARQRKSITDLSEATGIPLSTLRRRLDGISPLNLSELEAIASWLAVSSAEFLRRTEPSAA